MLAAGADFTRSLELALLYCSSITTNECIYSLLCPFLTPILSSGSYRGIFRGFKAGFANLFSIFGLENTSS